MHIKRFEAPTMLEAVRQVKEELGPDALVLSTRTCRALLAERVSIRDIGTILETLAEYAPKIQDADLLTDLVRERLGRSIAKPYLDRDGTAVAHRKGYHIDVPFDKYADLFGEVGAFGSAGPHQFDALGFNTHVGDGALEQFDTAQGLVVLLKVMAFAGMAAGE